MCLHENEFSILLKDMGRWQFSEGSKPLITTSNEMTKPYILAWLLSEKEKLTNRETFAVTAIRHYEMGLVVEWVMRRRHMVFVFLRRQITAALMKSANSTWGQSWKILFPYFEFWLLCYSGWSARCQGWDHEMDVLFWMCTTRQWEILDVLLQLKLWCSRFETISDLQR